MVFDVSAAPPPKPAIACTSCDVESVATLVDPVDEKGAKPATVQSSPT
jgi:hypothetical protein